MITVDLATLDATSTYFAEFPDNAEQAMVYALNRVVPGKVLKRLEAEMLTETAFPAGYLDSRVTVTDKASKGHVQAQITGRDRPTSVARFVTSGILGQAGVEVEVNPGNRKSLPNAFLVKLNQGSGQDDGFNLGLAVRLKKGQQLRNKKDASKLVYLAANVVLLYGPSVGQVLDDVAVDTTDDNVNDIADEFFRQLVRLA